MIKIHFSDFFDVSSRTLEEYGAFNVSLINDLPVFIDPFLIFNSKNPSYQELHNNIIKYLKFLRDKSNSGQIDDGLLKAWFFFSEVKQNWLGYSLIGNSGSGLGRKFAVALNENLNTIFSSFGQEQITHGSHLEKLCLVSDGVGRDNISDFTTNLIKEYLLEYTQNFAIKNIRPELRKTIVVNKVRFNYHTETWERKNYDLPFYDGDFVLLTPRDILTKDEIWISKRDLFNDYTRIADAVPNKQLRSQINNYFRSILPDKPTSTQTQQAIVQVIRRFPEFIEYYIRYKEDNGQYAQQISDEKVAEIETLFIQQVERFVGQLVKNTEFYDYVGNTYAEARARALFLKDVIENKDGYRLFYLKGKPITREQDLQILFRLTWFATPSDVNREVNDGRGPVDFKISRGSGDKSLVEFKLASNTQLKRNLQKQVAIYEKASDTEQSLKVIIYFSARELARVSKILRELGLTDKSDIILIDARADNKPSASRA
jgi:hypothetical protein